MVTSWKLIFRLAYDFLLYGTPGRKMAFQAVTDIRSEHVVTSLSSAMPTFLCETEPWGRSRDECRTTNEFGGSSSVPQCNLGRKAG